MSLQELKAQLESQQPLRDESFALLDQALSLLKVKDENNIRENFDNFDDRWTSLLKSVSETELENFADEEGNISIQNTLTSVDQEIQEIQETLQKMSVVVESEEDLYSYLEELQVRKDILLYLS